MRIVILNFVISIQHFLSIKSKKAMRRLICLVGLTLISGCVLSVRQPVEPIVEMDRAPITFDGERAYQHVLTQIKFGPRVPGSAAHRLTGEWIRQEMEAVGWEVEYQPFEYGGYELRNIIARPKGNPTSDPPIILGAHYDTRLLADRDVDMPGEPVPGANDGASGVAVLIELARALEIHSSSSPVWFVFFDAEDNGRIEGWDWILGSRYYVDNLTHTPRAVVIVDMVGDADLQLYYEKNSDPDLRAEIWSVAETLGFEEFIPEEKYSILDDHTPFLQAGIPAVDIIDFDYPYFHTTQDLPDKVSPMSLATVGRTLEVWLEAGG